MSKIEKVAAFFDLDGTLVGVNSGSLWMKRERKLGRISRWQLLQGAMYLFIYKFHMVNMESFMRKALKTIQGEKEEEVRRSVHEWFQSEVVPWTARGCRPVIENHRAQGHLLVLLTSSSPYESEAASRHFKLDSFIATQYEVDNGVFTGEVVRPVCYAEGKVVLAERFARESHVDLSQSYFYTDSFTDLPMLQAVGNPVAVNPDLRLSRIARKKNWPMVDWS